MTNPVVLKFTDDIIPISIGGPNTEAAYAAGRKVLMDEFRWESCNLLRTLQQLDVPATNVTEKKPTGEYLAFELPLGAGMGYVVLTYPSDKAADIVRDWLRADFAPNTSKATKVFFDVDVI